MQVIYICRYTQSMANLGESLRELENICLENDIPELFIVKSETNIDFLNDLRVIRDILRRSKIKLSILKNVQVIKSKEFRQIILNDFHLLPTSGHAEPLQITTTASSGFQKIFLDIVGPLPTHSENFKYILTKQCELTKYVEAYPLLHKDSETVAKAFVQNFILRKEKVDQHRCSSYYSLGEKVLVHNSGSESKLEPIFKGPYIVLEDRDPNVILDVNGKQVEVHKNRIKPYYE
nr:unnamed protein product [Callosobruchus chinensis]